MDKLIYGGKKNLKPRTDTSGPGAIDVNKSSNPDGLPTVRRRKTIKEKPKIYSDF